MLFDHRLVTVGHKAFIFHKLYLTSICFVDKIAGQVNILIIHCNKIYIQLDHNSLLSTKCLIQASTFLWHYQRS